MISTGVVPESDSELLVPVEVIKMHEADTFLGFEQALDRIMASELPAFVVRRASLTISENELLADTALKSLQQKGHRFLKGKVIGEFSAQIGHGIGPLHTDANDFAVKELEFHTTIEGRGKVLIAAAGPRAAERIHKQMLSDVRYDDDGSIQTILSNQLNNGLAVPDLISPELHVTELETGDHTIFPLSNANGPIWHRFDTASLSRMAYVSELTRNSLQ